MRLPNLPDSPTITDIKSEAPDTKKLSYLSFCFVLLFVFYIREVSNHYHYG